MPPNQSLHIARFGNDDFSGAQAFVQSQKFTSGIAS